LAVNESPIDAASLARLAADSGLSGASIVLAPAGLAMTGVAVEPDRPLYPASMIKVPIAAALALRCAAGDFALNERITIDAANLTTNDAPSPFVAGYEASLGDLLHGMVGASDNVATNVLIDVLGRASIGPSCEHLGLRGTAVRRKLSGGLPLIDDPAATGRNSHPAGDAARLFAAIEARSEPGLDLVAAALEQQIWNDKLSRGFWSTDRFAHKTGDTDEVSHDGGILTLADGRRFIIVVYTALPANPETDLRFGAFARALRPYLGT
jgi:beta-lactamase class A